MELQRGVCTLCKDGTNNKVLNPTTTKEFAMLLPEMLFVRPPSEAKFLKIVGSIKICILCFNKLLLAKEKQNVMLSTSLVLSSSMFRSRRCHFCSEDQFTVQVANDWSYFKLRVEDRVCPSQYPIFVCPSCLEFFDVRFNMRNKLLQKFPGLAPYGATVSKVANPKRKSTLVKPRASSKRANMSDRCFALLKPANSYHFKLNKQTLSDDKLCRKIAYINLSASKCSDLKDTPKKRPIVKIKFKSNKGKLEDENFGFSTRPFLVIQNPEEKVESHPLPNEEKEEKEPENNLSETPKTASNSHITPKRKVSLFAECERITDDVGSVTSEGDKFVETSNITDKIIDKNGIAEDLQNSSLSVYASAESSLSKNDDDNTLVFSCQESESANEESGDTVLTDFADKKRRNSGSLDNSGIERKKKKVTFSDGI